MMKEILLDFVLGAFGGAASSLTINLFFMWQERRRADLWRKGNQPKSPTVRSASK
jgi:H+/Cl- antiporter ClcA